MIVDEYPSEMDKEEIEEHKRLSRLYFSLTEDERRFVVAQWDSQHGLEAWQERLRKKEIRPKAQNRRVVAGIVAVLLLFGLAMHYFQKYEEGQHAIKTLKYMRARAPEHEGLHKGLDWIDAEMEAARQALWDMEWDYLYEYH